MWSSNSCKFDSAESVKRTGADSSAVVATSANRCNVTKLESSCPKSNSNPHPQRSAALARLPDRRELSGVQSIYDRGIVALR